MAVMRALHLFQILTPHVSRTDLDPGCAVLDNTANERPDWFEYWPMRRFLRSEPLDDAAFYGFLSPKFRLKTNLTADQVRTVVEAAGPSVEVILFSPSIHNSAYFLNVFEHGDSEHPGLAAAAERFFERLGRPLDVDAFISDSRNTVHSNYFVATPRFWRAWLGITERLFAIAESSDDPLGEALRLPTTYRGRRDVQMKIFLMERVATWLLVTDPGFVCRVRDPFAAGARVYKLPAALVCDALKIAYVSQGRGQYKDVFLMVRNLRKLLNLQVRIGGVFGARHVRPCLEALKSYWRG